MAIDLKDAHIKIRRKDIASCQELIQELMIELGNCLKHVIALQMMRLN